MSVSNAVNSSQSLASLNIVEVVFFRDGCYREKALHTN